MNNSGNEMIDTILTICCRRELTCAATKTLLKQCIEYLDEAERQYADKITIGKVLESN